MRNGLKMEKKIFFSSVPNGVLYKTTVQAHISYLVAWESWAEALTGRQRQWCMRGLCFMGRCDLVSSLATASWQKSAGGCPALRECTRLCAHMEPGHFVPVQQLCVHRSAAELRLGDKITASLAFICTLLFWVPLPRGRVRE